MSVWKDRNFISEPTGEDWDIILGHFHHGGSMMVLETLKESKNQPLSIEFFWKQNFSFDGVKNGINTKFKRLDLPYKLVRAGYHNVKILVDRPKTIPDTCLYYRYRELTSAQQKVCEIFAWVAVNKPALLPIPLRERMEEIKKSSNSSLDLEGRADLYQDAIARWVVSAHLPEGYVVSWPKLS